MWKETVLPPLDKSSKEFIGFQQQL